MRKVGIFSAWLLVTMLVTGLTWQIVSAAENQVSDGPVTGISLGDASPSIGSSVAIDENGSSSTSPSRTSIETSGSQPTSSIPPGTTSPSTTLSTLPGSSGTSQSSSTTSTLGSSSSTSAGVWKVASVPTIGGTLVVSYRNDEVKLNSVAAAPGFTAEVDKSGPPEVRVDFEGVTTTIEMRIASEDGVLDIGLNEN